MSKLENCPLCQSELIQVEAKHNKWSTRYADCRELIVLGCHSRKEVVSTHNIAVINVMEKEGGG